MTIRLTLLSAHAADTVLGHAPLSECDLQGAGVGLASLPPHSSAMRSPSAGSALTAAALGLKAAVEPALRDFDYGIWRCRTVTDIAAADPDGYSAWLTDPDAAPHGGETVRQLCDRTAHWLSGLSPDMGRVLAIAEPAVVQALLVHALSVPARAFWGLQVPPLHTVCLTWRGGEWSLRAADASSARGPGQHSSSDRGTYLWGERAA